jgi:type II secretory pathway pseudopilin PulG
MKRQIGTGGRPGKRSEAGDSLVEVLVAIVIIGLTATALLGALATSLTGSAEHRSYASIDTVLKSYAETAKYDIQLQPTTPWFADCASTTTASYNGHPLPSSPPAHYTVGLASIQYWNGVTMSFDTACGVNDHTGYQQLTFTATGPNGFTQSMLVSVRRN